MKQKNQFQINQEIEQLIKEYDLKGKSFTKDEISFISTYSGSGGQGKHGAKGQGVLYEFYTPDYICDLMWQLAVNYGYDNGYVLEPSCATGNLFVNAPDTSKCVGFEVNPISAKISNIRFPKATIYNDYFETAFLERPRFTSIIKSFTWLNEYPFSLIIGNPPYGSYKNMYSIYFKKDKIKQIEQFFFLYGLKMLKKNGLLIYLVSQNLMRSGIAYQDLKKQIAIYADFVDAYRLPTVFDYSEVPTDIIILRRK